MIRGAPQTKAYDPGVTTKTYDHGVTTKNIGSWGHHTKAYGQFGTMLELCWVHFGDISGSLFWDCFTGGKNSEPRRTRLGGGEPLTTARTVRFSILSVSTPKARLAGEKLWNIGGGSWAEPGVATICALTRGLR